MLSEAESALAHGEPRKAIAILSSHLEVHPKDVPARLALGQAYLIAGQSNQAAVEFQTVLEEAPGNVSALASVGEIYLDEGQLDKAEAMLSRDAGGGVSLDRMRLLSDASSAPTASASSW